MEIDIKKIPLPLSQAYPPGYPSRGSRSKVALDDASITAITRWKYETRKVFTSGERNRETKSLLNNCAPPSYYSNFITL